MITDAAVEAAWGVLHDVPGWPPYTAQARYIVSEGSTGEQRERELAALREADREADELNRQAIVSVLSAAEPFILATFSKEQAHGVMEEAVRTAADESVRLRLAEIEAAVREKAARAIERSVCEPGEHCGNSMFCPDCIRYRQAQADAALTRRGT